MNKQKIKVAILGVGNCASSFVQGIHYYSNSDSEEGLISDVIGGYKVSDIVVSASIEPEAFGRVSVEAQAMQKVIIASNIGGSNETVIDGKTGFLFQAGDAKSLSKMILKVFNMNDASLKLIGTEGRKNIIQKFNVEKMCFSTYSEYKKILN